MISYSDILKLHKWGPGMYSNKSLVANFSILTLKFHNLSSKVSLSKISFLDLGCHKMVTPLALD